MRSDDNEVSISDEEKNDNSEYAFEDLIRKWPNHDLDKRMAKAAWNNYVTRNNVDPDLVLRRGREWCSHWKRNKTKFIPYFGKWLKDGGWKKRPTDSLSESHENYLGMLSAALEHRERNYDHCGDDD